MYTLGISGSPRRDHTTDQLVQAVLAGCEGETRFVSLAGLRIEPCRACNGCIETNVCVIEDDMAGLRAEIVAADALVVGAPVYYGMLNAQTHAFFERFFQFRHREAMLLEGKRGVAVGVAGGDGTSAMRAVRDIQRFFSANRIRPLDHVTARGTFACHTCGYGETCQVGGYVACWGTGTPISDETTPSLAKQPEALAQAHELGRLLTQE